jgi:hypothetical protein
MRRKLHGLAAVTTLATVGVIGTAAATTGKRADFDLRFSPATPGARAALRLHVVYKAAGDPNGKPSPIRKVVIAAAPGTRFDTGAVTKCTATDDELKAEGSGACPPESRLGSGKLTADTGFGPPVDPVAGDLTLFNSGTAIVEVVTAPGTDRTIGIDRLRIDGSTLVGSPPTTPGGPPDGETAVRQIDFTIERTTGFVTTPPSCRGRWLSRGTFGFADGTEETVESAAPCSRPAVARLSLTPTHTRVGRPTRFTARVLGSSSACRRGTIVRIGGRRAKTGEGGRVSLTLTVRRAGAHRATAKKRGCATLAAPFAAVR